MAAAVATSIPDYEFIKLEIIDQIGVITLNRPKSLNSLKKGMVCDVIDALVRLDNDPDTIFTVITGNGRFFSAGGDISQTMSIDKGRHNGDLIVAERDRMIAAYEVVRTIIDHRKIVVTAMNGPGVGGGAAWFQSFSDLLYVSTTTYLEYPFSSLGIGPEGGIALGLSEIVGPHRANEILMFGGKIDCDELVRSGIANGKFPAGSSFITHVLGYLAIQIARNDGPSMLQVKKQMNLSKREARISSLASATDAVVQSFADGRPYPRFAAKINELIESRKKSKM